MNELEQGCGFRLLFVTIVHEMSFNQFIIFQVHRVV